MVNLLTNSIGLDFFYCSILFQISDVKNLINVILCKKLMLILDVQNLANVHIG